MSGDWQNGLFGCFGNCGLCLLSFFAPCYQFGKNAEAVGDSCCLCCLCYFIPTVHLVAGTYMRGKLREQKGIGGSMCGDFLTVLCCPFCAIVQEAREVEAGPGQQYMQRS